MAFTKRFLARKSKTLGEWGVWDTARKTFVGMMFTTKHGAQMAAKARNKGETLSKVRMPERDPETRRAIRRLELELHETRDIKRAIRILEKLVALYSELGDARGVIKCKRDLKRAEAISDRYEERKRRRGHRVSTSRRHHSRRGRKLPHNGDIIDLSKNVLWHKDDLVLVEVRPNGPCLLIQETMAGPVVRKQFRDSEAAVAYLLQKYGPLFFKSNDPSGKARRR